MVCPPETTRSLTVRITEDWAQIEALIPRWQALLDRSTANSIFLTPDWVMAWRYAMQGLNIRPVVVVVTDDRDELAGLALYRLSTQRLFGLVPYEVVRPMSDYATGAVYHDVIADPLLAPRVYDAVLTSLAGFPCDAVWLPHVAHWTGARDRFEAAARKADFDVVERRGEFFCIDLPADFADYEKGLSASTRKDLRRTSKRLLEGEQAKIVNNENESRLPQAVEAYVDMNTRRWQAIGQAGVFVRKPREADFYRRFTAVALARGWLRSLQMEIGGKVVAMEIGFHYNDRYYAMQGSYEVHGPSGTGKSLLLEMLKRELNDGAMQFDLLSGDGSYKQRYGAGGRLVSDFFLLKRSIRTLPLRVARFWPRGRYLDFTRPPGSAR
jgi:CelD/BcsL family acetyltransferase involved in cellulose biosynthesis